MSYLVVISDKHIVKNKPTVLDDFYALSNILTNNFGFKVQLDKDQKFDFFYHKNFPENILGYDDSVLWTKNPTDGFLQLLIEISNSIENTRVIGDEGEWYISLNEVRYLDSEPELKVNMFLEYLKAWTPAIILIVIFFILKILFVI